MIEEVILSSTTLDDTLRLIWEETQHTEGETFEYEINYYFDLETILSNTNFSNNQTEISFSGIDLYQSMISTETDTAYGYWWVYASDGNSVLNSVNGPSSLKIIIDQSLSTYSPFSLVQPISDTTLVLNQENITDSVSFSWERCSSIFNDSIFYEVDYSGILDIIIGDTVVADTMIKYSLLDLYSMIDSLELTEVTISGNWDVTASNGVDLVESINGPLQINIEVDSSGIIPISPFYLEDPENSTIVHIDQNSINDTLLLDWSESFSFYGDSIMYSLEFVDSLGLVNNDSILSFFSDKIIAEDSSLIIDYLSLYNELTVLEMDTLEFNWQVVATDGENYLGSINGPFHVTIVPLFPPLVRFELENPTNNYFLHIDYENITDTLFFDWSESYNFWEILQRIM